MKKAKALLIPLLGLTLCGCQTGDSTNYKDIVDYVGNKEDSNKQFDYQGNYSAPELVVDGLDDDDQYKSATEFVTFGSLNQAKMKMYRGKEALFCYFEVTDEDLETVGNNNGDDVTEGDSVEVYFDFANDGSREPLDDDIQINIGAHGKTRIFVGTNGEWGSWNGLLDYEVVLNGTLNDPSDVDQGYTVEVMIPYAQVGIDQNSEFGVAFGHVARGKESIHDSLDYTWGGKTHEGVFIDPQVPALYLIEKEGIFYSRDSMPLGTVTVSGVISDQLGNPVENANIRINGRKCVTNASGEYHIEDIDANYASTVNISKDGYKTYKTSLTEDELRYTSNSMLTKNFIIIDESKEVTTKVKGKLVSSIEEATNNQTISIGKHQTVTDENGNFEVEVDLDNDLLINLTSTTYKISYQTIYCYYLVNLDEYDLGEIEVYKPSQKVEFGGARNLPLCDLEIYRGSEGINFLFSSPDQMNNGNHIELFIDTDYTNIERDDTDYRFNVTSSSRMSIVNFGDGNNTGFINSGIVNKTYSLDSRYYMEVYIPYSFLNVESDDIIGFSLGVYSELFNDWDGFVFVQSGYLDYVAPEDPTQYCRIGLNNEIYRYPSNDVNE